LVEFWKDSENVVKDHFKKLGYTVLNQNDRGFPDLIVLKDGKVSFFVEVKAMQKPDLNIDEMQYHQYMNDLGFEVKCMNVRDQEPECFNPDSVWAKAVKDNNPLITKKQ
jgi:hypothetical protein